MIFFFIYFCPSFFSLTQFKEAGGLHKFINRNRPLITDSGGFQVFSLAYGGVQESLDSEGELKRSNSKNSRKQTNQNFISSDGAPTVKVTEDGVYFKSYRDGRKIFLTPESTIEAQKCYGADIIIPLDQLPPYFIDHQKLVDSVDRSHRWETRSLQKHLENVNNQAMYCVVHGGVDVELRTKSVEYLTSLPFDGYAIGGSLGKNSDELISLLTWMMPMFEEGHRKSKPRHLLGIADEKSILESVKHGIDTFDSCYPTRLSRHGTLLTRSGKIHIKSGSHSKSYGIPIDPECSCQTCKHYDRAYLWHLFKAKDPLFMQLSTLHNIQYMNDLMKQQRELILNGEI